MRESVPLRHMTCSTMQHAVIVKKKYFFNFIKVYLLLRLEEECRTGPCQLEAAERTTKTIFAGSISL